MACTCGMAGFNLDYLLAVRVVLPLQWSTLFIVAWGFPAVRNNELKDTTAHLLTEVCNNVMIEPSLQKLSGESLSHATANRQDQERADIVAI